MDYQERVYKEALDHYQSCNVETVNISDVWHHKLRTKGRLYSLDQLKDALAPGGPVLGDYFDYNFYVDPSVIDETIPISARILQLGQSDFANPLKDLKLPQGYFCSRFLFNVNLATQIIARLDDQGIHSPKIMEIGSGVAYLPQILRRYYGGNLTLFAVDLPETLMIQEWLLRNWFPDAPYTYKGSPATTTSAQGGINFVNAYVLESQDFPIDVVVNISSIQEMDQATSDAYFAYAARNLSDGGFFHYENHFGHGIKSALEPSEHNLDPSFTTLSADVCFQNETFFSYENMRLVLGKTSNRENVESRRFIHRLLWNGFNAGLIPRDHELVEKLGALPRSIEADKIAGAAGDVLKEIGFQWDRSVLESLESCPYIDTGIFSDGYSGHPANSTGKRQSAPEFMTTMWGAQSQLILLMEEIVSDPRRWSPEAASGKVKGICDSLQSSVNGVEESEFKAANLACFVMPLGESESGRDALVACADGSQQDCWLVRFAHLLSHFDFPAEAAAVLDLVKAFAKMGPLFIAKAAEIRSVIGQKDKAEAILAILLEQVEIYSYTELGAVARAAAILDYPDFAQEACQAMIRTPEGKSRPETLETLHIALLSLSDSSGQALVSRFLEELDPYMDQPKTRLLHAILKHLVAGQGRELAAVRNAVKAMPRDYHSLGWAGNALMRAGLHDLAGQSLDESLELNAENFLHREFIGTVYFNAEKWPQASENLRAALECVPYVRHVRARALYSELPQDYRASKVFSDTQGIGLVYQTNQGNYSDIIPSVKPVNQFALR